MLPMRPPPLRSALQQRNCLTVGVPITEGDGIIQVGPARNAIVAEGSDVRSGPRVVLSVCP
eukprot:12850180-Alexandrium_andersonii.AAC.1